MVLIPTQRLTNVTYPQPEINQWYLSLPKDYPMSLTPNQRLTNATYPYPKINRWYSPLTRG